MKSFKLDSAAIEEIAEAAEWYAEQRGGLEKRFLDEVQRALRSIGLRPRSFPRLPDAPPGLDLRRALLNRFPYAVVFLDLEEMIQVVVVAHTKRRPDYWRYRLDQQD